jgi:hypothetical protein
MARGTGATACASVGTRGARAEEQSELRAAQKQLADFPRSFLQTHNTETMSGTKLHVYCPNVEAVEIALARLWDDAEQFGWGMKAATARFYERHNGGAQHGKGVTIYLPHRDTVDEEIDWIARLLEGFPFAGEIAGDEMVTPALGKRFELRADPGRDLTTREYYDWYVPSVAKRAEEAKEAADANAVEAARIAELDRRAQAFFGEGGEQELIGGHSGARGTVLAPTIKLQPGTNPLLDHYTELQKLDEDGIERQSIIPRYAYAIPSEEALAVIKRYGPIVEIGAGTGYWAAMLRERGSDVVAYDSCPPSALGEEPPGEHKNAHCDQIRWSEIAIGDSSRAADHPDRALFLCWPPYDEPMAADALTAYTGETVISIGEYHGCTADRRFQELLDRDFELVEGCEIPRWRGNGDQLSVYRRKA